MPFGSPFALCRLTSPTPIIGITSFHQSKGPSIPADKSFEITIQPSSDGHSSGHRPQTTESENRTVCNDHVDQLDKSLSRKYPQRLMDLEEEQQHESDNQDGLRLVLDLGTEQQISTKRLDLIIFPLTFLLYLSGYLNRSNIGNAAVYGLEFFVLKKNHIYYSLVLSSFSVTYLLFSIAANVLLSRSRSPVKLLSMAVLVTSVASITIGLASNFGLVLFCRAFIGMGEAMLGKSMEIYYSLTYTHSEMSKRMSLFIGSAVLAGGLSGVIAYGIGFIETGVKTWRLVFLFEGSPGILLSLLCLLFLPAPTIPKRFDRNSQIVANKRESISEINSSIRESISLDWRIAFRTLKEPAIWISSFAYGCINLSVGSLAGFLPLIISSFGYSDRNAQLYTASPYFTAFMVMFLVAAASDKSGFRGGFVIWMCMIGSAGWAILLRSDLKSVKYLATFFIVSGAYCPIPLMLSWTLSNCTSYSQKATSIALMHTFAQAFTIFSSFIFFAAPGDALEKSLGYRINLAANLSAVMALGYLSLYYGYKNRQKKRNSEADGDSFRYIF